MRKIGLLLTLILLSGLFISGCTIESVFRLADESRLPNWLSIPPQYARVDLTVKFVFYASGKVKILVYGPAPDNKKIIEIIGTQQYHPITAQQPRDVYPRYIILTVEGAQEVLVHKQRDDLLYISDDPKLTNVLKQQKAK